MNNTSDQTKVVNDPSEPETDTGEDSAVTTSADDQPTEIGGRDGPEQYQYFRLIMGSPIGLVLLMAWTFAFFVHLGNGIRHLVWDTGRGFERRQANASAWGTLVMAAVLTALFWLVRL